MNTTRCLGVLANATTLLPTPSFSLLPHRGDIPVNIRNAALCSWQRQACESCCHTHAQVFEQQTQRPLLFLQPNSRPLSLTVHNPTHCVSATQRCASHNTYHWCSTRPHAHSTSCIKITSASLSHIRHTVWCVTPPAGSTVWHVPQHISISRRLTQLLSSNNADKLQTQAQQTGGKRQHARHTSSFVSKLEAGKATGVVQVGHGLAAATQVNIAASFISVQPYQPHAHPPSLPSLYLIRSDVAVTVHAAEHQLHLTVTQRVL